MVPIKEDYKNKRIDDLEDQRFKTLFNQVGEIHTLLVGNGKPGLIREVSQIKTKVKILMWVLALITSTLVGTIFGGKVILKPNADGELPDITIERPQPE